MLWSIAPFPLLVPWFVVAEATLRGLRLEDDLHAMLSPQMRLEQEDLLGELITFRTFLQSYEGDGRVTLLLCQQALALLSPDNHPARVYVAGAQFMAYNDSSANDVAAAIQSGLQAGSLAQKAGRTALAITLIGATSCFVIEAGQLHEAHRLARQAIQLGTQPGGFTLPDVGWPMIFQAEILREWNQLDRALALVTEALSLCKQIELMASFPYLLCGYAVLLRIALSRGELHAACSALQQFERIGMNVVNKPCYLHYRSFFTTIDQVRLWLACGDLDRAIRWAEELDLGERHGTPFAHERQEVARIRVLLAQSQPARALERLEPVLKRATAGKRWGHIIEIRLLQALALQMLQQQEQALSALWEAVRLAEPEGYIRSFLDEGTQMAALLSQLRQEQQQTGPTPYLDTLLAAFSQQSTPHKRQPKRTSKQTKRSRPSESKPSKREYPGEGSS